MDVDLRSPNYTSISKRARTVEVNYRRPPKGSVAHLVIDATGVKVFGEGEWKVLKHGREVLPAIWDDEHPRNEAAIVQQSGQLEQWKTDNCYLQRSLAETAIYRYKQLLCGKVTLRNTMAK